MSPDQWRVVEVIGALLVAVIVAPLVQFWLQRLTHKHERDQILWQRKTELVDRAQWQAGHLHMVLARAVDLQRRETLFWKYQPRIEKLAGRLGCYPELQTALLQFLSAAAGVDADAMPGDKHVPLYKLRGPRLELDDAYKAFLTAVKRELDRYP